MDEALGDQMILRVDDHLRHAGMTGFQKFQCSRYKSEPPASLSHATGTFAAAAWSLSLFPIDSHGVVTLLLFKYSKSEPSITHYYNNISGSGVGEDGVYAVLPLNNPFGEDPTRILAGRSSSVLNSKLVSAAMAVALFSFALFEFSKSEPSITHSGRRTRYGFALNNEPSEKLGFSVKDGCPSLLCQ
ncbi:hypothetical protein KY290_030557 [Solanum tuberosum]|uniref:Uncharacterized protein n=1 Tax=Solanum tuberosum TaxID=4113 RepID=A0ABQ7U8L8_SOLTU|nr:hypothetical protein KY284_031938 [Solanum tuberosum]KAH0742564.1 hypothetical protein KY290_030557 [Solanum tuberosum]